MERYASLKVSAIVFSMLFILSYCGGTNNRPATLADIIPITVKSTPAGADVYIRIASDSPEVQNTNRSHIGTTPYNGTRTLNITGMDEDNMEKVTLVIEVEKPGYVEAVERLNILSILNSKRISLKFHLSRNSRR